MKKYSFGTRIYLSLMFLVLYLPIFYLIFYSFNKGTTMNHFEGMSLIHYRELLEDTRLLGNVVNTLIIALLSAVIATEIGTFGAMAIYFMKNRFYRHWLLNLNNILIVTPDVMIGASFLILLTRVVVIKLGFWSVLVSHVAFNIPIVVLMVLPRLEEMNDNLLLVAKDLGANVHQILVQVILPSIQKGIFSGFLMALTYSFDDFAVTFFVTGNGFSTLALDIYSRARRGISLEINALSTLIFGVSLAFVIGYYFIQVRQIKDEKKR